MPAPPSASASGDSIVRRHPITSYFLITFVVSWTGSFLLVAPRLLRGEAIPKFLGIMMFPVMLLGPSITGLVLTAVLDGKSGLQDLFSRMRRARVPPQWYLPLLVPPILILSVLLIMKFTVGPAFTPNFFLAGLLFGVPAGFLEEIGWTGYALPRMLRQRGLLPAAILLGILWSAWHLPVIDHLGSATPHGTYWLPYFLAFASVIIAIRVLIAIVYVNTGSVLLAQLIHVSSTGSLVIFSPPRASPAQETLWYFTYAAALWVVVAILLPILGQRDTR